MTLTPAEALVLLDPDGDNGVQAAKVTFLALMAEGVLRLDHVAGRVFGSSTRLVVARQPAENPPHVAAVLDAVRDSKAGTVSDVASVLSKATQRFATIIPSMIRPRLIQRGLLVQRSHTEQRRTLFFFRRTVTVYTYHPTEAGAREQARLRAAMDEAPAIRAALDENPSRAAAMAMALGPMIVLVPILLPFLGQLAGAMGLGQTGLGDSGAMHDTRWMDDFESAAADIDSSLDDALSDAESDSSSDGDSDGDSGGDSGGSDGGGE